MTTKLVNTSNIYTVTHMFIIIVDKQGQDAQVTNIMIG